MFVVCLVQVEFVEWIFTVLAIFMLATALLKYFFVTAYRLTEEGIEITFLGKTKIRKWKEFQSFYLCKTGIQLSTFPKPSWLDSFRGHFVLLNGNREQIISFIRLKLNESG